MAKRMISVGGEFRVVARPVQKAPPKAPQTPRRNQRSGTVASSPMTSRERAERTTVGGDGLLWLSQRGEVRYLRDAERLDRVGMIGQASDYTARQREAMQAFAERVSTLLGPLHYQFDTDRILVSHVDAFWRVRMRRWSRAASFSDLSDAALIFDQDAWNRLQCPPVCTVCGRLGVWHWSPLWRNTAVGITPACQQHRPPADLLGYTFPSGELAAQAYNQVELFIPRGDDRFENARGMLLNGQHVAGMYGDGVSTSVSVWCVDGKAWLLTADNILRLGDLVAARQHFLSLFQMSPVRLPSVPTTQQPRPEAVATERPGWYATSVQAMLDRRMQQEGIDGQGL